MTRIPFINSVNIPWPRLQAMVLVLAMLYPGATIFADQLPFGGLAVNLGNIYRLSNAQTRSVRPENFTGGKGAGGMPANGPNAPGASRELGQGWKASPNVTIAPKTTFTLTNITGPGVIQQIWMTPAPFDKSRFYILRIYWDGETSPSVKCPVGDFFACGWGRYCQINSLPVCVNPASALNCYWAMPFRKHCRITLENLNNAPMVIYYQINYALTDVQIKD